MTDQTLYDLFGVKQTASLRDIRMAYRLLAMKKHPAHNNGSETDELFRRLGHALLTLTNPASRSKYDAEINGPVSEYSERRAAIGIPEAEQVFFGEMKALATELAAAGYDQEYIKQAFTEEGCPPSVAAVAAASVLARDRIESSHSGRLDAVPRTKGAIGNNSSFSRLPWMMVGVCSLLVVLGYLFVYLPSIRAKEEEARILTERAKAAEAAAKKAAEDAKMALEKAEEAERKRKEAEQLSDMRGSVGLPRSATTNTQLPINRNDRDALALRDSRDFAMLNALGSRCQALSQQVEDYMRQTRNSNNDGFGAMVNLQIYQKLQNAAQQACNEYSVRLSERRNYEAALLQRRQ